MTPFTPKGYTAKPAYNDGQQMDARRQKMKDASDSHLIAIILSGKSYGPVNMTEIMDFINSRPAMKRTPSGQLIPLSARERALLDGRMLYDGKPCKTCQSTRRFTLSYKCVACEPGSDMEKRRFRMRGGSAAVIMRIAKNHNLRPSDITGKGRQPHIVRCRQETWFTLSDLGVKISAIARMFGTDHSSVRYGIEKYKQPVNHLVGGAIQAILQVVVR